MFKENFGIKSTSIDESEDIVAWFKDHGFNTCNKKGTGSAGCIYYIANDMHLRSSGYDGLPYSGVKIYTFSEIINEERREFNLYKLIQEYPDSPSLGFLLKKEDSFIPDKIFLKYWESVEPKYKIGDWCIITNCGENNDEYNGVIGTIFCIRDFSSSGNLYQDASKAPYIIGDCWRPSMVRLATPTEVKKYFAIEIGGECARFNGEGSVSFGCQEFDIDEIITIKRLLEPPIHARMQIDDIQITRELIDKILKSLKNASKKSQKASG